MAKDPVLEAVKRLRVEHQRTQTLDYDKALSICRRRGLQPIQIAEVRGHLIALGVLPNDVPGTEGWEPEDLGDSQVLDILGLFLKDLQQYRLLTPDEERRLSLRVRAMVELQESLGDRLPTPSENAIVEVGSEALERFVLANIRLVIWQARKVHRTSQQLDLLDLVQEGTFGLRRAVEKFDPNLGYKFSTYGTWWVKQSLQRAVAALDRTIRWPVHAHDEHRQVQVAKRRYQATHGTEPGLSDLADATGFDPGKIQAMEDWARVGLSLSAPVSAESTFSLDQILASQTLSPEEQAIRVSEVSRLRRGLDELDERSAKVIRLRFGLDGESEQTLEQIGGQFGLSRERIRQIETKTLLQLRSILGSDDLSPVGPGWDEPVLGITLDEEILPRETEEKSSCIRPLSGVYALRPVGLTTADRILSAFGESSYGAALDAAVADHVLDLIITMNAGAPLPERPSGRQFDEAESVIAQLLEKEQNRHE